MRRENVPNVEQTLRWQDRVLGALASARTAVMAMAVKRTLQPHRVSRALVRAIRRAQPRVATAISVLSAASRPRHAHVCDRLRRQGT